MTVERTNMFDAYEAYKKSDPDRNRHFSRRWVDRPLTASEIDRIADMEIGLGHHRRGEQLAHLAEQMRTEAGR